MNKANVKSFAVWARKKLTDSIKEKVDLYGGNALQHDDKLTESASLLWFKFIILLRYMEVNNYFNQDEPKLISLIHLIKLPVHREYDLTMHREALTELYEKLNSNYPWIFNKLESHMLALLPDVLFGKDSIMERIYRDIHEEDFKEIEIIGWMYQFFMSEKHENVVGMNNGIIRSEDIPAATQLFTPKWIVKYMVDNSLGKLLLENGYTEVKNKLEFYISNEADMEIEEQRIKLEEIKILDPACGSGHILVYVFDVLHELYLGAGYGTNEASLAILEKNIYGMEIDDDMAELCKEVMLLKANSKDYNFLKYIKNREVDINIISLKSSDKLLQYSTLMLKDFQDEDYGMKQLETLTKVFTASKDCGALLEADSYDISFFENRIKYIYSNLEEFGYSAAKEIIHIIKQGKLLNHKYDVVIANPPYMSKKYMNENLKKFINANYREYNGDLFSVFIMRNLKFLKPMGYAGYMTPFVWMFINEYEKLRAYIIENKAIISLIQLEYSAYEDAAVPICTFVLKNSKENYTGDYIRLVNFKRGESQSERVLQALKHKEVSYRYRKSSDFFKYIRGNPLAFWLSDKTLNIFIKEKKFEEFIHITGSQNITADNDKYLRRHWEVNREDVGKRWQLYNKGGDFRKWYGNVEYVVDWSPEAREFYKKNKTSNLLGEEFWFRDGLTYNGISVRGFAVRKSEKNLYDKGGPTFHIINEELELYFLALLNSKVINFIMDLYNPTINYQVQDIKKLPIIISEHKAVFDKVTALAEECVQISKNDWNAQEISWEFTEHPLLKYHEKGNTLEADVDKWMKNSNEEFKKLKCIEEEINRIFIGLYGFQEDLSFEVLDKDVTVSRINNKSAVKSFISYCVGCILGRYSLNSKYVHEEEYKSFICGQGAVTVSDTPAENDLYSRLLKLLCIIFGEENLKKNVEYIAVCLGSKKEKDAETVIRTYFLQEFFKDHFKVYKKTPVYCMISSGKRRAFNSLVYTQKLAPGIFENFKNIGVINARLNLLNSIEVLSKNLKNSCLHDSEEKELKRILIRHKNKIAELNGFEDILERMKNRFSDFDMRADKKLSYDSLREVLDCI